MIVAIAATLLTMMRQQALCTTRPVTFQLVFIITALAFFTPWLVLLPLDILLIASGYGAPIYLVPFHLLILAWEAGLVVIGFQHIFALTQKQACRLGVGAVGMFLLLGAIIIR